MLCMLILYVELHFFCRISYSFCIYSLIREPFFLSFTIRYIIFRKNRLTTSHIKQKTIKKKKKERKKGITVFNKHNISRSLRATSRNIEIKRKQIKMKRKKGRKVKQENKTKIKTIRKQIKTKRKECKARKK